MKLDSSFVVIDADWTCAEALEVLAPFATSRRVIVHRMDPRKGEFVYAFDYREAVQRLQGHPQARVVDVLNLHEYTATPTAHSDGAEPGREAVVLDRGRIAGVAVPGGPAPIVPHGGIVADAGPHGLDAVRGVDDHGQGDDAGPRTFGARVPSKLEVGKQAWLLVTLGALGDAAGGGATIAAVMGSQIDLLIEASGGIAVVGPAELAVTIDSDDEITRRFQVEGRELGAGRVMVRAFQGANQIALVTATTEIVAAGTPVAPPIERRALIQPLELPPDLDIEIEEDRRRRQYRITVTASRAQLALNRVRFGPITLDRDVDEFFTNFYADIERILTSAASPKQKLSDLGQQGVYLFERIVPPDLRARLWQVRDEIRTIRIQSEEPWVPWELCKLSNRDATGVTTEDKFISERYAVTRWFLGVPELRTFTMSSIGLVVPPDSGLRTAAAEQQAVESLKTPDRDVIKIKSQAAELRKQLASGSFDVLHFVGHGAYQPGDADYSSIKLERGARFRPRDLAGRVASFGVRKPIVVLNACEVGRSGTTLGGLAGWPQAFIKAGAAAFVGPLWKVADGSASEFSTELYSRLLAGDTIGEAVQQARSVIRAAEDPTWLAYIAYAHPDARIKT